MWREYQEIRETPFLLIPLALLHSPDKEEGSDPGFS